MNVKPKAIWLFLVALSLANCWAADSTTREAQAPVRGISRAPTNFFSSWTSQSSNLTVLKPGAPWGGSSTSFVYVDPDPSFAAKERARQAVRNALASQHENQKREQRLQSPDLTSLQHVGLSSGTNSITIKP
jgi:hypothetical protein